VRRGALRFLERGNIYFTCEPRANREALRGPDDVDTFAMILGPRGTDPYRLVVIAEKRLPAVGGGTDRMARGVVEYVSTQPEEVEDPLDPKSLLRKARGERFRAAARPAGEGDYAIVRHNRHTHLVYVRTLPPEAGEVQRVLNIVDEGSYIAVVKNPKARRTRGVPAEPRRVRFPKPLQERFGHRPFIPLEPKFLNHEGAGILLVGAKQDVEAELGVRFDVERESETTADIFDDLLMERSVHPVGPFVEGRWE
jgi:hypothetical protein